MLINENILLKGKGIVLVPYTRKHVPRYHEWMQDPQLQQQTASEPLTIEEEYQMQTQWQEDEDKLTFIINCFECKKESNSIPELKDYGEMIGDVNLFFNDIEDASTAELEIMIAEREFRGRGHGKEACLMMMSFAANQLNTKRFIVKIGMDNLESLIMFAKLGFVEISKSEIFQEITLEKIDSVLKYDYELIPIKIQ